MSASGPELTSVVAELARRLPRGHVAAWARVLRSVPDLDAGTHAELIEARLIEAKPGVAIGGLAAHLMAAWRVADPKLPGAAITLALESAALV
jgi:putative cardiolipin synthase